jgi:phenylacetate-coenzyme A ligase PaaK-like adenylate-forming protein
MSEDVAGLVGGPPSDEATRQDFQLRRFRSQAGRAARETRYYANLATRLGTDLSRLGLADLARLPVTSKETLRAYPDAFVRRAAKPIVRALTSGTTGRPTSVAFSEYELRTMVALSALGFLRTGQLAPDDVVQISTSARAVLGNLGLAGACARIGAGVTLVGVVEPELTLALLRQEQRLPGKKPRVSCLSIYPSYLGELIDHGLANGYRPSSFGLERIFTEGEIVTAGLKARAHQLFGPVPIVESYALTTTSPFGGSLCEDGHLHFETVRGLLEVLDPETHAPVGPGEVGTLVATPFPPFRETTLLLRYDTQDAVQLLAGPFTCSRRTAPATSNILGKQSQAVRHDDGWTFPRDVREALEAVAAVPLPARGGFREAGGGVAVEVVTRADTPAVRRAIAEALEERGVPLRALHLVEDPSQLRQPLPLRCDLRDASAGRGQLIEPFRRVVAALAVTPGGLRRLATGHPARGGASRPVFLRRGSRRAPGIRSRVPSRRHRRR